MKKMVLLVLSVMLGTIVMGETVIGYVDTQVVLENYKKTAEIQKTLETKKQELQEMLNKEKDKITKREEELEIMGKEATKEAADKVKAMKKEFQEKFTLLQQELDKSQYIAYQNIKTDISTAISNVAETRKIDTVVDKAVVYFGGEDITKDVIEFLSEAEKIKLD